MKLKKILLILRVIPKLGFWNVLYTAWYKISLKMGWRKKWFPTQSPPQGIFFTPCEKDENYPERFKPALSKQLEALDQGIFTYFSFHKKQLSQTPNWFYNPFEQKTHSQAQKHWTEISDFGEGDIKIIWELSRFDWLTTLARGYKAFGKNEMLNHLNDLLSDWAEKNPLNQGPNWKCGQETSIRIMKLLTTAHILQQYTNATKALQELVFQHLIRVAPNLNYAIAQDNNHGTSEAADLYIGATWLIKNGRSSKKIIQWKKKGRKVLEERILYLVQKDGTFAQRSMTYHRVMVDTMSFVLHQMELLGEPKFSEEILQRLVQLGLWQYKLTFGENGDAPNFGSNDGAMLNNLHSLGYRNFSVSTQSFFSTLKKELVYKDETLFEPVYLMFGDAAAQFEYVPIVVPEIEILDDQMLLMKKGTAQLFMKLPESTFRPGNDVYHLDLWLEGKPVMIDAGTFSYNAGNATDDFKSVAAHNTVQFGTQEQMPKISRFLNGEWIGIVKDSVLNKEEACWEGSYTDFDRNRHWRKIQLSEHGLSIVDEVNTPRIATARFHFNDKDQVKVIVKSGIPTWQNSLQSLYYLSTSASEELTLTGSQKMELYLDFTTKK